jgi:TolB-like protein/DNA-binding winged helix-turn-helix (wHTH) protein
MESNRASRPLVRFGIFEVDLRTRELRKRGVKIKLQEQPFLVLETLLDRPGELVTREELRRKIWPADTTVDFELGVNTAVNRLRLALGDSAENSRYVETLPRRGYRFIAPIVMEAEAARGKLPPPLAASRRGPRQSKWWSAPLAGAALITLAAVAIGLDVGGLRQRLFGTPGPPPIRSLAVLPLQNLSGDPSQEYFADGMTDELITELGKIGALRVISRTSVMQYKGAQRPLPQIGRELNVEAVVEGSVVRSGDRVRITAQLIYAPRDQHLWAESYEGDLRNILNLQSDVARAIADQIKIKLTPEERARVSGERPVNPEAYDLFLKGMNAAGQSSDPSVAIKYFQQATEKDPGFARAHTELADLYNHLGNGELLSPQETYPWARTAALRALAVNETLSAPHDALAWTKFRYDWDWSGADKEFKRALELDPNDAQTHADYFGYLILMGRFGEAGAQIKRAQELNPLYLPYHVGVADLYYCSRQYDRAIAQLRETIQIFHLEPELAGPHTLLGKSYKEKGMFEEAIAEDRKAAALPLLGEYRGTPLYLALLGNAYGAAGKRAEALNTLQQLKDLSKQKYVSPYDLALVYLGLGDKRQTFMWLDKAYRARSNEMSNLKQDPIFDSLRSDRRFQDLLQRMAFPP